MSVDRGTSAPVGKALEAGCPSNREELLQTLKEHTISVMEEEKWALLLPSSRLPPWPTDYPEGFRIHWKHFRVEISAENGDPQQNQVKLGSEQLEKIREQVVVQTRLIPITTPYTETSNETAVIPLKLEVYVRRTRANAPRSLVVVLHQTDEHAVGRLIYGEEMGNGNFTLLWDSPIILARYITLGFDDVDGDGTEEIVFNSAYPAGMHDLDAMTIFNIAGKEMTRTLPCVVADLWGYSEADGTCPIVGDQVQLDYSTPPAFVIWMNKRYPTDEPDAFALKNGQYVSTIPQRARRRK